MASRYTVSDVVQLLDDDDFTLSSEEEMSLVEMRVLATFLELSLKSLGKRSRSKPWKWKMKRSWKYFLNMIEALMNIHVA